MIYRFFKLFAILIFLFSCKNTETYDDITGDEIILSFDKVKKTSITRDISYLPRWQERIEFEGSFYIPLSTDKQIYSFTPDSVKYSLIDRIWLKAKKQGDVWNFTKLTVLPNDIKDSKSSGLFIYEDWKTGYLSYEGYIEDKLFSPIIYKVNIKMIKYGKKAMNNPDIPCQMVTYQVCAGDYPYTSCTTRVDLVGNCNGSGGGGSGGGGGGDHGGGGGGGTPPIIPPDPPSEEDKEIIDSLQGYPCAQEVLAKIPNLENKISKWLNKTFANNVNYNIMFRADPQMSDSTDGFFNGYQTNSRSNFTIMLNGKMLKTASQEYIAVTMFHEALHGFLGAEMFRLRQEGKPEQFAILY